MIVKITPTVPDGYTAETGDVCDIYRLSVDRPALIVRNAIYGITYVDPYPAFNEHGGHLVVAKTANEDYITSDGRLAWLYLQGEEKGAGFDEVRRVIRGAVKMSIYDERQYY